MLRFHMSGCLRSVMLLSLSLVLLLPAVLVVTPVSADGEGWYLQGEPVINKDKDQDNPPCYVNRRITVTSGQISGQVTYSAECFKEGSGAYTGQFNWNPPPAYLKPGENITFTATAVGSRGVKTTTGIIKAGGKNIVDIMTSSPQTQAAVYTVPRGSNGNEMEIFAGAGSCGLTGGVLYKYKYLVPGAAAPATTDKGAPGRLVGKLPPFTPKPWTCVTAIEGGPIYITADSPDLLPSERRWVKFMPGENTVVDPGWIVWTPPGSKAAIKTRSCHVIKLGEKTWVEVPKPDKNVISADTSVIWKNLYEGIAYFYVNPNRANERKFDCETHMVTCHVYGTEFVAASTEQVNSVKVIKGSVEVKHKTTGAVTTLNQGQQVIVTNSGPGPVSTFDTAAEKSHWPGIDQLIAGIDDEIVVPDASSQSGSQSASSSSGQSSSSNKKIKIGPLSCFIATAAYGSETAGELNILRSFRDSFLMQCGPGRWLVEVYYVVSPPLADMISRNDAVRAVIRFELLDPLVTVLKATQPLWQ